MTAATLPRLRVLCRWLIHADFREILAIERASFPGPRDEAEILRLLGRPHTLGMVADHGDEVVGFMLYTLNEDHIDVLDFAVDPAYRRRGIGVQMANKLIVKLYTHRRGRLVVDVPETSESVGFWATMGFRAGLVRGGAEGDLYRFVYANGEW